MKWQRRMIRKLFANLGQQRLDGQRSFRVLDGDYGNGETCAASFALLGLEMDIQDVEEGGGRDAKREGHEDPGLLLEGKVDTERLEALDDFGVDIASEAFTASNFSRVNHALWVRD